MVDPDIAARFPLLAQAPGAQKCRVCGCTENHACVDDQFGPCWWVEPDLCSHCGEPMIIVMKYERLVMAAGGGKRALTLAELNDILQWSARAYAALQHAVATPPEAFELGDGT